MTTVGSSRTSLDPSTLAKLGSLQVRARRIVEGYLAGLHRSPYQGFSIEFAEHREYAPGDDLRHLDWKVFGRTDKLYLKQYEDETNLICYLTVDATESMEYRGVASALSKFEYGQCLAAAIAWLVLRQQDAAGLVTFGGTGEGQEVPPNGHASHLERIVNTLDSITPKTQTAVGNFLAQLAGSLTRRGVVIVISDLFDNATSILQGLHRLRIQRHDVVVLQVLDRDEVEFPFDRPTLFRGLESLPDKFADPRTLGETYRAEMGQFCEQMARGCRQHGIDYFRVVTSEPLDRVLAAVFHQRASRQNR